MRAAPVLALSFLLAAASAGAQTYGRDTPWDDDENMAATLPRGSVQGARPLRIRTVRPACFVAAGFPVVRALIEPYETVESARLFFRPEAYPLWYQVTMVRSGEGFLAALPKPRPSAQRVHYFVEATAPGHPQARGQQHVVPVVEEAAQCTGEPGETAETASVAVRVPKGAPMTPPVPPGFVPVGAVSLENPERQKGPLPLIIGGGFAAVVGGLFALPGVHRDPPAEQPRNEITFVDSSPPPDGRLSLSSGPGLAVRVRIRTQRAVGPGNVRVVLFRVFAGGPEAPCAVLVAAHAGFPADTPQEVVVGGPFQQAQVCQPSDRLRLALEENGQVVVSTGLGSPADYPARYFIDP